MAGLALVAMAYTEDSTKPLSSLRGHTPLSDNELRTELFVLRLFGAYLGFQMGVKGPNEISVRAMQDGNIFHEALIGDLFPVIWGNEGLDGPATAEVYNMINMYVEDLRERQPAQHQRIEEMRILAPKRDALISQLMAYWKEISPTAKGTVENVGAKFCANCQAGSDAVVQSTGAEEFLTMLNRGLTRAAE